MFLVIHASVGALIGNVVGNPTAAFSLGFASHFLLDMIPHGDCLLYEDYKCRRKMRKAMLHISMDALMVVAMIMIIFFLENTISGLTVAAGMLGGLLPDLLVGLFELTHPKGLRWSSRQLSKFHDWHMRNHVFLIKKFFPRDIPLKYGYILQAIVIAVLLKLIL
jgi:hypothetical protein